jgi:type 1 glutamine amidotransferase
MSLKPLKSFHLFALSFLCIVITSNVIGKEEPVKGVLVELNKVLKSDQNFKILVYDETSGFTHNSRDAARIMFSELGEDHGFDVDFDRNGDSFNNLENLQDYAVVVFSNTSGNEILSSIQKNNFEEYIRKGGNFLGIHAATDTYRTGWDWYRDLVGGSVRTNPNHTDQNFPGIMDVLDADHPATSNVPDPWSREEEWYYWKGGGGYLFEGNINLLQLRATGDNDYDETRPISWYKEYDGGRSFYTAMGHANSVYSEVHFRNHILGAIQWLTEELNSPTEPIPPTLDPIEYPEPVLESAGPQEIILTGISPGSGKLENVIITASSDNPGLIPNPEIAWDNSSGTATLTFQPVPQETGTAEITVTVDNGEENNNLITRKFIITVVAADQPLIITEIEDQETNINGEIGPIVFFIIYEGEEDIDISIASDNPDLIPIENVVIEGNSSERTMNITPVAEQSGTANITITVTAGEYEVNRTFKVEVHNIVTAIQLFELEEFRLFPNPAEKVVYLNLEEGNYNITMHDMAGRGLIRRLNLQVLHNAPAVISLDGMNSGLYILFIESGDLVFRKKLMIR